MYNILYCIVYNILPCPYMDVYVIRGCIHVKQMSERTTSPPICRFKEGKTNNWKIRSYYDPTLGDERGSEREVHVGRMGGYSRLWKGGR